MKLKDIKIGSWYKTKAGVGTVLSTTKFRNMVELRIVWPLPMGQRVVPPRDVLEETVAPAEGASEAPAEWKY